MPQTTRRAAAGSLLAAATLALFAAEAGAAQLKAVQTNTTTLPAATLSVTAALAPAVDMTKSFLVFGTSSSVNTPGCGQVSGQITLANQVTFARGATTGCPAITIKWYVAEFASGVSVRRGSFNWELEPPVPPGNIPLAPTVDTTRSFPLISYRLSGSTFDDNDFLRAKFTAAGSNLEIGISAVMGVSPQVVEWQVVEFTGATVQSGDVAFAAGDFTKTATAPANFTAIVPGRTWLVYGYDAMVGGSGLELDPGKELVRGVITNGSTLTFDRNHSGGGTTINLTWYLIEFTDGTSVQHQSQAFAATEAQRDVTLPTAVSTATSIAVAGGDFQRGGRSGYGRPSTDAGGDDNVGVGWFRLDLTSSTNLRITRGAFDPGVPACTPACPATADVGWFVISFNATCCALSTAEVPGNTITVTGAGQFEMRFNSATGGGVDTFYDLALDPARSFDLVGSIGNASHDSLFLEELEQGGGASYWTNERVAAASQKLDLLEATPTRVKVRAESFYGDFPGGNFLPGLKAIGDYSVHPSGRMALRWNRMAASNVPYTSDWHTLTVHYRSPADPLSNWATYSQTALVPTNGTEGTGSQQFLLSRIDQAQVQADFLLIRAQDWPAADTAQNRVVAAPDETLQLAWRDSTPSTITGGTSQAWNYLTYFKPTNLGAGASPWLDTAVTTRSTDYRTHPAGEITINAGKGLAWSDTVENTAGGDWFNEAEAAYPLELHQSLGLDFDLDGSTKRYSPFFKIRGWRSFVETPTVTLEGTALRKDVDYKAAVKPFARAYVREILWYSSLDNAGFVTAPDIGSPGTVVGAVGFVAARYGSGASTALDTRYVRFPTTDNFDKAKGGISFWYQPTYASTDGVEHDLAGTWSSATNAWYLTKAADNNLHFRIVTSAGTSDLVVTAANYSWRAADWVHLRLQWDDAAALATQQRLFVNGREPPRTAPVVDYNSALFTPGTDFVISNVLDGTPAVAPGIYDEFYSYGPLSVDLAHGGLVGHPDEYLADPNPARNYTLNLAQGTWARGPRLFVGTDTMFRGINFAFAQAGVGLTAADATWDTKDGVGSWSWLSTGAPGFTDGTNGLTKNGTVYWTGDPAAWNLYSIDGGPDLYYVRVNAGDEFTNYSVFPREAEIKPDVLLFQYCGDVSAAAQNFVFGVPPTTEVKLQSFAAIPGDASVALEWRTASELDNLGFHVYRSLSEAGPWSRLNPSLIPGLGSSAVGQAYSFRDAGLVNGTRYFYRLEDVDASSRTTAHGPVSAVPAAGAPGGAPGSEPEASPGAAKKAAASASCPDWVVAAYASMAGASASSTAFTCTRHGDPEAVSFAVVSRDSRQATLELRTGGFYALHEASGKVRTFVPGFDFPQDPQAPALPVRRVLVDAVVGRRAQLAGARALDQVGFKGLVPASLGKAEMEVSRDGTVRAQRRALRDSVPQHVSQDLARLWPSVFQGETKSAVVQITPLRYDARRRQIVLSKRVLVKLLFTARETGESGRGSFGRRERPEKPVSGELLARLYTTSRGLHAVSFEQLFPGRQRGFASRSFGSSGRARRRGSTWRVPRRSLRAEKRALSGPAACCTSTPTPRPPRRTSRRRRRGSCCAHETACGCRFSRPGPRAERSRPPPRARRPSR